MRKSKESKKRQPTKATVAKRATSRRTNTSRSRTSRTARTRRRTSPKSTSPAALIEISKPLEQVVAGAPAPSSKRYPIQNVIVLFLAFAATSIVGGWAAYVALFGEKHQEIGAATTPAVVVEVPSASVPSAELPAPKAQDRVVATPQDEIIITSEQPPAAIDEETSRAVISPDAPSPVSLPTAPEVTAALPAPVSQPPASGPVVAREAPVAGTGRRKGQPEAAAISPTGPAGSAYALVAEARRHLGTNPTGRKHLWCGAFVDLVLRKLGYKGGGNLASAYARYGARIPGPQIGAIAVMTRKGGGHVGIVSGFDKKGRPLIISGNYRRTVAETIYPGGRIYAYVVPSSWARVARTD